MRFGSSPLLVCLNAGRRHVAASSFSFGNNACTCTRKQAPRNGMHTRGRTKTHENTHRAMVAPIMTETTEKRSAGTRDT